MTAWLYRLGKHCVKYGWLIVTVWLVIIAGLVFATKQYGGQISNTFTLPDSNSQKATDIIQQKFPSTNNGTAQIVFHAQKGSLVTEENNKAVEEAIAKVTKLSHVSSAPNPLSPFTEQGGGLSLNKTIAYTTVTYDTTLVKLSAEDVTALTNAIQPYRTSGLQIELGGNLFNTYNNPDTEDSEKIGLVAAAVILLITFGSVIAMGLPILSAVTGLGIATMLTLILARFVDIPGSGPAVATMIGIGVGIDYALFIISRHREHLALEMPSDESIGRTIATSGQAVIVAGGTVIIANLGLLVVGIPVISAIAYATAIAVACAIIVALTLLPAVLGLLGTRINSWSIPFLHKSAIKGHVQKAEDSIWGQLAHHVTNRPWRYILGSLIVLTLLIIPVFKLKLGSPNPEAVSPQETQRKAYDLLSSGFGVGVNDPLLIAIELPKDIGEQSQVLQDLYVSIRRLPGVVAVTPAVISADETAALMTVIPATAQNDPATTTLVRSLTSTAIPSALKGTQAKAYVGGVAASFIDITQKITSRMVLFISMVLLLTFLLLMIVFRSLFIPFKAVVMNLLSVLSAFGVIVMIFQWGWGQSIIGLHSVGPIVSYVPLMIFAILFGLSMDYEVFILSRVREEYIKTGDNKAAVVEGITRTSRLISAAALIMISVFMAFVISKDPVVKMFGVGLAFAVFIDATIIRLILVPATMDLAGKANWWFPSWLKKIIPDVHFEDESVFDKNAE